jgi:phosphoglucomutase
MSERAGQLAQPQDLIDIAALLSAYSSIHPDVSNPEQKVIFGTSGHRGSSFTGSFNEDHIAAITQAIVEYRKNEGIQGPIFVGKDTHALSEPAEHTALEVLAGNDVPALVDIDGGYTPTPAVSVAIINHNVGKSHTDASRADGLVITPSHNPPADGGFKYNPPHGGPADSDATNWIAKRANELIAAGLVDVQRVDPSDRIEGYDFFANYVDDLANVIDMEAIHEAGVRIGADPLGGASVAYWGQIAAQYGLDLTVVNPDVDPQWAFMTLDWDEKIRMDP